MNATNLFFCIMDIHIWHLVSCGRTCWLEEVPTESQAFWLVDTTLCLFLSHSPAVIIKHFSCELIWSGFHFLAFCTLLLLLPDFHGCLANLVETKEWIPFCYPCNSDPVCIHTEFIQRKTSKHEFQGQWRYCVSSILLHGKSAENQIADCGGASFQASVTQAGGRQPQGEITKLCIAQSVCEQLLAGTMWNWSQRGFYIENHLGLVAFLLQPACINCRFYFERKQFLVSLPLCKCLQTSWCLQFKLWVTTAVCYIPKQSKGGLSLTAANTISRDQSGNTASPSHWNPSNVTESYFRALCDHKWSPQQAATVFLTQPQKGFGSSAGIKPATMWNVQTTIPEQSTYWNQLSSNLTLMKAGIFQFRGISYILPTQFNSIRLC